MTSSFLPIVGDPILEESYFSWVKNQPAAMSDYALIKTTAAIKDAFGARLNSPARYKDVVQMVLVQGNDVKYLRSHDEQYLRFQKELADTLCEIEPDESFEMGVTGYGINRGLKPCTRMGPHR